MTWRHKEGDWCLGGLWNSTSSSEGGGYYFTPSTRFGLEGKNEDGLTFTQWLDLECERNGPWEVLKISRVFEGLGEMGDKRTWVVFRQKI
jgi:hypothetical protein